MGRRFLVIVGIAAVLGTSGAAYFWLKGGTGGTPAAAPHIVRPERRTINSSVTATGTVRLRVGSEIRVGSQLSGIVTKLNVTVGSHVVIGAVIAEIDDRNIRARLAQAEAQVTLDRATLQKAKADESRARRLWTEGLVPDQQAQDLLFALQEAQARYEKSCRDQEAIRLDLAYVHIRSPITGTIASVSTQEGETVAASFTAPTFVTIIGDRALQLVALVDETDIAAVRRGQPVAFRVESYPSRDFSGEVLSVAPKATILSGVVNYEVTIEIENGADLLKPDMTANVSIRTSQHEALVLPSAAVQREGDQYFVYVDLAGRSERRPVVIGAREAGLVEVKKGVTTADRVVVLASRVAEPRTG